MSLEKSLEQRFLPGMSPGLVRVAEAVRRDPERRLLALAHHIDVDALRRAFHRTRRDAAVGVDGVTKEKYGENLEDNLRDLHQRLKSMRYRHQPIRRVYIDKEGGKKRPIGISCLEDKVVQEAVREILGVLYEPTFSDGSYGFRPARSAHDALRALNGAIGRGEVNVILEADIVSFFDRLNRKLLKGLLQKRLADKSLMRLIGKCLHAGILDNGVELSVEEGTVQGSTLSPLLANVYLHYALDRWFECQVKPRLKGRATLIRFADDFVIGFERQDDAQWVMSFLGERLAHYGLELHPEKTRLVDFGRPLLNHKGKGPGTFDFLGFTYLWQRGRQGRWRMATKTRVSRLRRAKKAVYDWCRRHRHGSVAEQHAMLVKRIRGHFNYFGVRGNQRSLADLLYAAKRSWFKWLKRRSQRSILNWTRFAALLGDYPLPAPVATTSLWVEAS